MRWLLVAASAGLGGVGLGLMAAAARHEAAGRLAAARRVGRRGGFIAAAGAVALALSAHALPAAAASVACGAIALLGGLSGKPRPAVWFAAIAFVGALIALLD